MIETGTGAAAYYTDVMQAVVNQVIPVAFLDRTSNERLQDPVASMRRQVRNSRAWLPPGCQTTAYYWDVESGGDDLEDRGHSDAWQVAAAAGIPRDGGIADLLHEAKSPAPDFAFVVCEDIERSARSMYNSLKLERELQDQGIPLFATDEPFNIEGINATTVLVRRVKQGVAEWYRLQLKGKVWDGLKEHSLGGKTPNGGPRALIPFVAVPVAPPEPKTVTTDVRGCRPGPRVQGPRRPLVFITPRTPRTRPALRPHHARRHPGPRSVNVRAGAPAQGTISPARSLVTGDCHAGI